MRDEYFAVLVREACNHAAKRLGGVWNRAGPRAGMERRLCGAERDVDGAHAAERCRNGWRSFRKISKVCDNHCIAFQKFCMFRENLLEALDYGHFFTVDDELCVRTIAF